VRRLGCGERGNRGTSVVVIVGRLEGSRSVDGIFVSKLTRKFESCVPSKTPVLCDIPLTLCGFDR
jgi:hypothetical protein